MVAINTDRLQDANLVLHDSASAITADALCTVGGSAAAGIIDIGGATSAGQIGATNGSAGTLGADACFDVQFDVAACDVTSGDEVYELQVIGSNSSTFASGVVLLGVLQLGDATTLAGGTGGIDTDKGVGTHILTVRNRIESTAYRYVRANVEVGGTTPSITFGAYISKLHRA
jgi:hypothetical protein